MLNYKAQFKVLMKKNKEKRRKQTGKTNSCYAIIFFFSTITVQSNIGKLKNESSSLIFLCVAYKLLCAPMHSLEETLLNTLHFNRV